MDHLRWYYLREKKNSIVEIWEYKKRQNPSENYEIKPFVRSGFPIQRPLNFNNLLSGIRSGDLLGSVQCDIKVPDNLKKIESLPSHFENTPVSRSDIGEFMKGYTEENKLLTQPRKRLITSFHVTNGTIITSLFIFI